MSLPPDKLAEKMSKKYGQNTSGKGAVLVENLTAVIQSGVNPLKLAAAKDKKAIAKLRQVFESGLWRSIMESIPEDVYLQIIQQVAATAYDTAVAAKKVKYDIFAKNWAPLLSEHVRRVRSLPDETDSQREQRMIENLRGLKKLKGAWRRITGR